MCCGFTAKKDIKREAKEKHGYNESPVSANINQDVCGYGAFCFNIDKVISKSSGLIIHYISDCRSS
jgi:hypothetical protein